MRSELLSAAADRLRGRSASPRADAEILLAHVLGGTRAALLARGEQPVPAPARTRFEQLVQRRARGEPVAYLTGMREFWSLGLEVTPQVLVPRPETELLVEWALGLRAAAVLDLATGCGAIALAIARERADAAVTATDCSRGALDVAQRNARRLGLERVEFLEGSWWTPVASRRFGLVVANPPYVAENDPHLADLKFEPAIALTSGADGLEALRIIAGGAADHLHAGGWLLVEHGAGQGPAVRGLFEAAGFAGIETRRDLAGLERATGGHLA